MRVIQKTRVRGFVPIHIQHIDFDWRFPGAEQGGSFDGYRPLTANQSIGTTASLTVELREPAHVLVPVGFEVYARGQGPG